MVTMSKTIQLGIRLEQELVERIEFLAQNEGIDRNIWIKRALATFVDDEETGMSDEAIEDFIQLRIDETALLSFADFSKIPDDILQARKEVLLRKTHGKNIPK